MHKRFGTGSKKRGRFFKTSGLDASSNRDPCKPRTRRPRILFMDEGTSHLDLDKEREVNRALAALNITRIVIAHRPETLRAADRVVVLRDGILGDANEAPVSLAAKFRSADALRAAEA